MRHFINYCKEYGKTELKTSGLVGSIWRYRNIRRADRISFFMEDHDVERIEITQYDLTIFFNDSPDHPFSLQSLKPGSQVKRELWKLFGLYF